jgi:hypothetical protein
MHRRDAKDEEFLAFFFLSGERPERKIKESLREGTK